MPTQFVTGTSVGERFGALRDGIIWNIIKGVVIGGVAVSLPGTFIGMMIPGEGMTRIQTIEKNLIDDHTRVWRWAGQSVQGFGEWINSGN